MWITVGALLLAALAAAALAAKAYLERGMFVPGTVAARVAGAGEGLDPAGTAGPEDPWPVAPGVTLHHFATGSGEDVVVLHGGPAIAPARPWHAAALLPGLRLHFYHQRGCGLSSRPITAAPAGSTWQRMVAAEARLGLAEQLADLERIRRLLGRERLVLVGHSFGAVLAALYAAEFPERVRALVLVAPAPLFEMPVPGQDLFATVRARLPAAMQDELDAYLAAYFDFPALLQLDEARLSEFYGRFLRFYAASAGTAWRPTGAAHPPGGWMQLAVYLSLGRRHDWRPELSTVTVPVLVVHGELDLQPVAVSERIAGYFPRAQVCVIPGSGHFPFDEAPEAFAAAVREFLRASAGTGPG